MATKRIKTPERKHKMGVGGQCADCLRSGPELGAGGCTGFVTAAEYVKWRVRKTAVAKAKGRKK